MNYAEQHQYLKYGRLWAAGFAVVLAPTAVACACVAGAPVQPDIAIFSLIIVALTASLSYTPDYLHLTVNPQKAPLWEVKIRWRVLGAAFIMGMVSASSMRGRIIVVVAIAALCGLNYLAKAAVPLRFFAAYFWTTDLVVLVVLFLTTPCSLLLVTALFAASAHLSVVICRQRSVLWAGVVSFSPLALLIVFSRRQSDSPAALAAAAGLLLVSTLATAGLVNRAQRHSVRNIATAIGELADFTGYSEDKIRHLWLTSNQQLAKNWEAAALKDDDPERLAEWYRQNSELYMFAISGYNLEYRRIRSNLYCLKFARGRCLDYGAGNGELLLDLARQGHSVMYYDVEGTSMEFARRRAQQRGLKLEFARSKDDLVAAAQKCGFDTVFSFDVLEHLPDLPGELRFLASLLGPGGRLMFDVPAGSTKAHPMHLDHSLDVCAHLRGLGLEEERSFWQKLSFKKQEKYLFRARS